ncbi:MAG: thioredoxin domain-containing protein [Gemmatimonadetes bacterium]|nr:thioredoxin domain-containing protein [Gemmatimonadota bacterium]
MKIGIWPAVALVVFTALVTWGISRPQSASLVPADSGGEILADVGGYQITRQEVEEVAPDQFIQAKQQLHDLTDRALSQAIDQRMMALEAEKEGLEEDSLISREVLTKVPDPTEERIDSVYNVYREQLNEAPRDSVAPQIRDFLQRQASSAAMQVYIAQLRTRYDIRNYLEPTRIEVEAIGPSKGPPDAPITLVEFSDFECPFCVRVLPTLEQVEEAYGDQVRIVYRQFPLNGIHPNAQLAAEASLCADAQGKFWEMHDAIFEVRGKASADELKTIAAELGLDTGVFDGCLDSREFQSRVAEDLEAGRQAGVTGTPALFINGRFLSGAQPFSVVSRVIDDELTRVGG